MHSFVYANMLPQELANQFDFVTNKFVDAHFKPSQAGSLQGIDEIQIDLDNLRLLKSTYSASPTLTNGDYVVALPNNYRNLLNDRVSVASNCSSQIVLNRPTRPIGDEAWETTKVIPFTLPTAVSPISKILGNNFYVNAGGNVITSISLTYIRKVLNLDVVTSNATYTEFPEEVILKIIDLTRNRILELVKSDRTSTAVEENKNFGLM